MMFQSIRDIVSSVFTFVRPLTFEWDEFPAAAIHGLDREEIKELREVWDNNPIVWSSKQPKWDLLFWLWSLESGSVSESDIPTRYSFTSTDWTRLQLLAKRSDEYTRSYVPSWAIEDAQKQLGCEFRMTNFVNWIEVYEDCTGKQFAEVKAEDYCTEFRVYFYESTPSGLDILNWDHVFDSYEAALVFVRDQYALKWKKSCDEMADFLNINPELAIV